MKQHRMCPLSDQAEAYQDLFLDIALAVNVFSLVAFLALATITVLVISRGIFMPAALLSQAAQAVRQRSFSPETVAPLARRPDEIGHLAQAFVQMVAAVEAQEAGLQVQIDEARAWLGAHD